MKTKQTIFAGLIAITGGCANPPQQTETKSKPNIIFILADDLGYGDVGYNGQDKIKTPHIDRMAQDGVIFSNHYSGSTVCGPSRASLMTGKHIGHCSVRGNPKWTASKKAVDLGPSDVTVAKELKRAGYETAVIGKWGLAEHFKDGMPLKQGFDYFFGFADHYSAHHYYPDTIYRQNLPVHIEGNNVAEKKGKYSQDMFTEEALNYIKSKKDTNFFLYLAYTVPHLELAVPEDSKAQYADKGWPIRTLKSKHYHHDPDGHVTYAAMVSRMDKQIGQLMALLKELNIDDNTLVIFTSDNGHEYDDIKNEFFNSNGIWKGKKRNLYEGGIHMPFVARWPGKIPSGSKSDHISAFWDFLPTACEMAGITPTDDVDGISYLPALLGDSAKQKTHSHLYWEFNEFRGPMQAVRKGNWKAVKLHKKPVEVYNLADDPGEMNNLAEQNPEITKELTMLLETSRTEHSQFPLEVMPIVKEIKERNRKNKKQKKQQ